MQYEVEQKFPVTDLDALKKKLTKMGGAIQAPVKQCDRYFAHPVRDFAKTDEALRIRSVGEANFVTYKGPKVDLATKTRHELELPLEAGQAGADRFAELLRALGFTPVANVQKTRQVISVAWQDWQVEGALDDVQGLGTFSELELVVDQPKVNAAQAVILSLSAELGLVHPERRSYLELLLENT